MLKLTSRAFRMGLEKRGVALRILDFKGDRVDTHSPQG
jgi:hypothetical protein